MGAAVQQRPTRRAPQAITVHLRVAPQHSASGAHGAAPCPPPADSVLQVTSAQPVPRMPTQIRVP